MQIGEACGVRAAVVDLRAGVLELNATAVRLEGKGTVLQERPKSAAGWRVIALPPNVVELCRRRMAMVWPANEHGLLFPTMLGKMRNPSIANRDLKAAVERTDPQLEWLTSHTFRKRSLPGWTRPACPPGPSPTTSATPSRA